MPKEFHVPFAAISENDRVDSTKETFDTEMFMSLKTQMNTLKSTGFPMCTTLFVAPVGFLNRPTIYSFRAFMFPLCSHLMNSQSI